MSRTVYAVVQAGFVGSDRWPHTQRGLESAQREAARLNAEADEECGAEVVGDGAASVIEVRS